MFSKDWKINRSTSFLYFNLKYAIKAHDKVLEISGGKDGIRDIGLLKSVIGHVKNDNYYPLLEDKVTHIVYSIAISQSFIDGNKRSAIALGGFFLEINGYGKRVGTFIIEMENIILWTAQGKINKKFLLDIITSIIEQGELTEEVKLKLISILDKKPKRTT